MTKLKLHYDGWLSLPTALRRRLGVDTGDRLDIEWTDGGLMLKAKGDAGKIPEPGSDERELEPEAVAVPKEAETEPAIAAAPKPKRKASVRPTTRSSGKLAGALLPKAAGRKAAK